MPDKQRKITYEEWIEEGLRLFGEDRRAWAFRCPVCGHVATSYDLEEVGAPISAVGYSCIGRWMGGREAFGGKGKGPCNYAGGGLFNLNPVLVTGWPYPHNGSDVYFFAFADPKDVAHVK